MQFGKADWRNFERGIEKQWILTNGLGGYASSTIIGANIRKYHGLLIASLRPPVERYFLLSKYIEEVQIGEKNYNLSSDEVKDGVVNSGYKYLQKVTFDYLPKFTYTLEDVFIEKTITMQYGHNTTAVVYRIKNGQSALKLTFKPLINHRDHHGNTEENSINFSQKESKNSVKLYKDDLEILNIISDNSKYHKTEGEWFKDMFYANEEERGLDSLDSQYIPGYFEVKLKPHEEKLVTLIASTEELKEVDGEKLINLEEKRLKALVKKAGYKEEFAKRLVIAADNFIVERKSTDSKTVLAGFPWFTDWGRDTMIALPGLTLCTNRYEDAKDILYTFSKYVKNGLLPNCFPDEDQEPMYNTVDAPLWYYQAVYKYLEYTKDYDFIKATIYPALKEITKAFIDGTENNTHMEEDGLIWAGTEGTQLTWMDVKVDDWVATPRHGKAVEINALWYNALNIMQELAKKFDDKDAKVYKDLIPKVKKSFNNEFWNEDKECLYDVINENGKNQQIRPNQIIALSLPYTMLDKKKAKAVLNIVWKELYATYGLRSLSQDDEGYIGIYTGDRYKRDAAYHNGTVWGWLIGPFITAYRKVNDYSEESREVAKAFIEPFIDHIKDDCINSIAEVFDGDEPIIPKACFAQAWSVSEVLRAYKEDVM